MSAATGFEVDSFDLPEVRTDVPLHRRRRAALLVLAIQGLAIPEEVTEVFPNKVIAAFGDELELGEALDWVDLLLEALAPRTEAAA